MEKENSRRKFLQQSAVAVTGIFLSPGVLSASSGQPEVKISNDKNMAS